MKIDELKFVRCEILHFVELMKKRFTGLTKCWIQRCNFREANVNAKAW